MTDIRKPMENKWELITIESWVYCVRKNKFNKIPVKIPINLKTRTLNSKANLTIVISIAIESIGAAFKVYYSMVEFILSNIVGKNCGRKKISEFSHLSNNWAWKTPHCQYYFYITLFRDQFEVEERIIVFSKTFLFYVFCDSNQAFCAATYVPWILFCYVSYWIQYTFNCKVYIRLTEIESEQTAQMWIC